MAGGLLKNYAYRQCRRRLARHVRSQDFDPAGIRQN
jgi:hypothetical protein